MKFPTDHLQNTSSGVRNAHADSGVLHGTGDACVRILVDNVFDCLQCLCQSCGVIHNLSVGKFLSRPYGVAVADLPRGDSHFLRHQCQNHLQPETALGHAKPPERACRWIVCIVRPAFDLKILVIVRTCRMGTGPLKHGSPEGRIGSGVRDDTCLHSLNDSIIVTSHGKFHIHRVTLRMDQNALVSG